MKRLQTVILSVAKHLPIETDPSLRSEPALAEALERSEGEAKG